MEAGQGFFFLMLACVCVRAHCVQPFALFYFNLFFKLSQCSRVYHLNCS